MVKVLQQGKLPKHESPWWLKVIHECGYCGARYLLEHRDPVEARLSECGHIIAETVCPTCKQKVTTRHPDGLVREHPKPEPLPKSIPESERFRSR